MCEKSIYDLFYDLFYFWIYVLLRKSYIFSPKDMDKSGYSSIVLNSPKLETTQMTTNSRIDMYLTLAVSKNKLPQL